MGCIKSKPHIPDPTEPTDHRANEPAQTEEVEVYQEIPDHMVRTIWMKTSPRLKTCSLVVAIDFGTTYSAYAYAHVGESLNIMINKNWEDGGGAQYKTPTCLCIDDTKPTEMHSFGLHAQKCYNSPDEEDNSGGMNLRMFHQFKMNLYAAKKVNREMEIADRGESMSVRTIDVFAMAMKFFKDHCLNHIKKTGRDVAEDETRWVVTVPAIWKDVQKMFMREAAVKAGLIQDTQDRNLMIALEPEAAGLYCKSEYNMSLTSDAPYAAGAMKRASHYSSLQPGDRFLVIDAGGGTVDITAYEILESNKCKEVISPVGGAYGGKKVNEQFERLLSNIFGKEFLQHCRKENPSALFEMMLSFETEKRHCHDGLEKSIYVALHYSFGRAFEDFSKTTLKEHFQNKTSEDGVTLSKTGKLMLPPVILKSLFHPVVDSIVKLVGNTVMQRDELKDLQKIFLVGGFGQCPYLETQLKQHLIDRKLEIVKPEEASLCVLRGAVMCGLNPDLIESRIAPRSYFIEAVGTDDSSILSAVIKKGQSVPHDHVVLKYCEPADPVQSYVQMNLFAADNESDKTKVCEVKVSCTAAQDQDTIVEFYFRFGGTEIEITGYHAASKTMVKTSVDFLRPQ